MITVHRKNDIYNYNYKLRYVNFILLPTVVVTVVVVLVMVISPGEVVIITTPASPLPIELVATYY